MAIEIAILVFVGVIYLIVRLTVNRGPVVYVPPQQIQSFGGPVIVEPVYPVADPLVDLAAIAATELIVDAEMESLERRRMGDDGFGNDGYGNGFDDRGNDMDNSGDQDFGGNDSFGSFDDSGDF